MNRRAAAAVVAICVSIKMRRRKKRSIWVKDWIKRRAQLGAYNQLLSELEDPECYRNFLRMKHEDFQYLCNKISPAIKKQDTNMRLAISVEERLAITLRFLASGDSYRSLSYLFRVPRQTISKIIPECCEAIYTFLKQDYMKVSAIKEIIHKIQVFQRSAERSMLGLRLKDRKRNKEIRRQTKLIDAAELACKLKWRWAGHVARATDGRWSERVLH